MLKKLRFLKPLALLALIIACPPTFGLDLPVNAEADRLLLAAEKSIESNNQLEAKSFLSQAKALNTTLPNQFYFLYGSTFFHLDELDKASINLIRFVEHAERGSQDYNKALGLLTAIEKRNGQNKNRSEKKQITSSEKQPTSLLESSEVQYLQQLKQLYLTSSTSDALLKHINDMLVSYALKRQQKIIKTEQPPLARYRLSQDFSGNLVTSIQKINVFKKENSKSVINTTKINIYGIDPFITYHCSSGTNSCWLRSPINGSRWIEFSNNEEAAAEISRAITSLIKVLQKGGG
ncbi:MAG: hypothetical protein JKY01_00870 [Pseudomonadales bacterium]|nr:hypothetical protein [Pseudomonadales bacterium]